RSLQREHALPTPLPAGRDPGPAVRAMFRVQDAQLAAAIQQLPDDMRAVIVRRVFQQEPFEVVAQALNRSPGAARVLWTRALRRLRELLGADGNNRSPESSP